MDKLLQALGYWGVPATVIIVIGVIFAITQLSGEIIEWSGKVAPRMLKLRKTLKERRMKKKKEKENLARLDEIVALMTQVETTLQAVNSHYDDDNIAKRNKWIEQVNENIKWTHERAQVYDDSVKDLMQLKASADRLSEFTCKQIKENYRNRILDFQHRISNARGKSEPEYFSREEFTKIHATYEDYEEFLEYTDDTNHQVDNAMKVIRRAELGEMPNIVFIEDLR